MVPPAERRKAARRPSPLLVVLMAVLAIALISALVVALLRVLGPQQRGTMQLMPAVAPLSQLEELRVTSSGWRQGEQVTFCLVEPGLVECTSDSELSATAADQYGVAEVALRAQDLLAQGLTQVVAQGERGATLTRNVRLLQEPSSARVSVPVPTSVSTPTPEQIRETDPGTRPPDTPTPIVAATPVGVWRGEYFANVNLAGTPALVREDPSLAFDWGSGSPTSSIPADLFSARWTRVQDFKGRPFRFLVTANDGVRLFIDDELVLDKWQNVGTELTHVVTQDMQPGTHELRVEYFENTGDAQIEVRWVEQTDFAAWQGEYFDNPDLAGEPLVIRGEAELAFNWLEDSPVPGVIPEDGFSVRWTRAVPFEEGTYRFTLNVDDGARLFVDQELRLDRWEGVTGPEFVDVTLSQGVHVLRVEYHEDVGEALAEVAWSLAPGADVAPDQSPSPTPLPTSQATPAPLETLFALPTATPTTTPTSTATPTPQLIGVLLDPAAGWAGTRVTVRGERLPPGVFVIVSLLEPLGPISQAVDVAGARVGSDGKVEIIFQFPDQDRWLSLPQVQISLHDAEWQLRGTALFTLERP